MALGKRIRNVGICRGDNDGLTTRDCFDFDLLISSMLMREHSYDSNSEGTAS